ncbi:unnamed protein product [Jaminaea pallidilutea]
MSSAMAEEQPRAQSSWGKARGFFSSKSKKRQSMQVGADGSAATTDGNQAAAVPYHLEDDDAQDSASRSSMAQGRAPKYQKEAARNGRGVNAEAKSSADKPVNGNEPAGGAAAGGAAAGRAAAGGAAVASPPSPDQKARRTSQSSAISAPPGPGERDPPAAQATDEEDGEGAADPIPVGGEVEDSEAPDVGQVIEFLHKGAPYYWLSNHFLISIYYDNIRYPSAEHLFQSLKFPHRPDIAKAVRKAETPSEAVKLARRHAADVRRGWRQEGLNVIAMREVLLLKFTQHSALRSRLLQTGDAELINASPTDVFWGSGRAIGSTKPGVGRNELGKALSRTRDQLLNSAGLGWGSAAKTV